MIRVMHVCSDTNIGGAGRYLLNLLEETNKAVYELVFVLPKNSKLTELLAKYDGQILEVDITPDASFNKKDIKVMKKVMKEWKPDIVHTHASLSARIAAKLVKLPVVYTRHYVDTNTMTGHNTQKKSIKDKLKSVFNNQLCNGVIGVATQCEPVLLDMGIKKDKITIIPNGVTQVVRFGEAEVAGLRATYQIGKDDKVITILARLSEEKGHDVFVDVIANLVKTHSNIKAVIAGTGPEEEAIREMIKARKLESYIIMTGFVEHIEEILNITSIQMNTAYTEAQSLALSEGMSLGIPAVVTDVGGNPSMIRTGKNGFVAPSGDSQALADCVRMLLDDEACYLEMSQEACRIYKEDYTASQMTKSTEAFYEKILERENK